jgi:transcriptional regulator with XRE-family HTH domain
MPPSRSARFRARRRAPLATMAQPPKICLLYETRLIEVKGNVAQSSDTQNRRLRGRAAGAGTAPVRAAAPRSFDLAHRVRSLRDGATLTLRELSLRSGISISALSKIENGQLSPTYEKIAALARGLGVDVATLFASESARSVTARRSITRRGQGIPYNTANYGYELLCAELTRKRMIPLIAHVKAREIKDFGPLLSHAGEEVILVLKGRIVLHTEFYEPTELATGDCVYFDSRMGHGCVARGIEAATIFWVCSSEAAQDLVQRNGASNETAIEPEDGFA